MDETGHASGGAVPVSHNGTSERGESTRLASWAPASAQPDAPGNGSSEANGVVHREDIWSSAGAALEPATDPLSRGWRDSGGYARARYPDAPSRAAAQAPIPTVYPTQPQPAPTANVVPAQGARHAAEFPDSADPAGAPPYSYEADTDRPRVGPPGQPSGPATPPEPTGPDDWASPPAPLPPGHVGFGEATPPHGLPVVPPPVAAPPVAAPPVAPPPVAPPPPVPADEPGWADDRQAGLAADRWGGFRSANDPRGEEWRGQQLLPQRIPAEPDVPALPEGVPEELGARAEAPELARIATYLRHDDVPSTREGFDVDEVLTAVRAVPGVRGARLRRNPGRVHTLRLDLADGADPGRVSRVVARLLSERMGLSAALGAPDTAEAAAPPATAGPSGPAESSVLAEPLVAYRGTARSPVADAVGRDPRTEYQPRRRHPGTGTRGRAAVEQRPAADERPSRPLPARTEGVRVVLDHVQVSTFGLDATVQVRLKLGGRRAMGEASGPAVDGYVLRLCAVSAAAAVNELLVAVASGTSRGRCFVEHAALVPFGSCEVAVAVVLLVCDGWVEQLSGSAVVAGDPRQAVVRATLAAVNRRLESLLP